MYKLICIEGFDRIGKDYLVDRLGIKRKKLKIYNKKSKAPDYRGNPHVFENWIQQHLINQLKEITELRSNVLKIRYFTSEYVYSTLFNRKTIVDQIFNDINGNFEISQYIMLFRDYNEYFTRCIDLNSEPEYEEGEFYIPEMLISARAMKAGMELIKPILIKSPGRKVVILKMNFVQYLTILITFK